MSGTATCHFQIPVLPCKSFYSFNRPISYDVTDNKTKDLYFKSPFITMNDIFHREDERLKTFENWPLSWLDKKQLAQTGMFYTNDHDKVKCYFCEVEIGRWEIEDQPVSEHLRWSPNCPLLRRRTTNNVPIDNEELNQILPQLSYDICGANDSIEQRNNNHNNNNEQQSTATETSSRLTQATSSLSSSSSSLLTTVATPTTYYPEYPEYAIETARERSFSEWPRHMKQKPKEMAEAGFFHSGIGDRVKCFSCGGGLKDWDDSDEPWEQHALWLPKCRFLKLMKSESYIEAVIAKHKAAAAAASAAASSTVATTTTAVGTNDELTQTNSIEYKEKPSCSIQTATATTSASTSPSPSPSPTTEMPQNDLTIFCDKSSICAENERRSQNVNNINCNSNCNNINNTNIPEEKLCKICYANEYNTAFLPCGHVVACAKCASSVTKCPMCRKPFTDVMRVYFS